MHLVRQIVIVVRRLGDTESHGIEITTTLTQRAVIQINTLMSDTAI